MSKIFNSPEMTETIRRYFAMEKSMRGLDYRELSRRLAEGGVEQSEGNLRVKMTTGKLGTPLFLHLLMAMGVKQLDMEQIDTIYQQVCIDLSTKPSG
ncbi:DUF6471 domain-containing protein [uncultured Pseudoteredinibacter sp.]|uniref:DUF6471 domain-containing protein n=1 Tax=uncultured Pseudoteredinibacter sp. TaxID=1641701 RepID=UPI0026147369|nr:DUF6471 domain-containing protein [uncultured Pseudoteredinibacter sp.]